MKSFLEQVKNIFKKPKEPAMADSQKVQSEKEIAAGRHNDSARQVRKSEKYQLHKKLWRNIFHF